MLIRQARDIQSSEITDERTYQRRDFIRLAGDATLAPAAALLLAPEATTPLEAAVAAPQSPLQNVKPKVVSTDERSNGFEEITSPTSVRTSSSFSAAMSSPVISSMARI